jgi:hypothetical protein
MIIVRENIDLLRCQAQPNHLGPFGPPDRASLLKHSASPEIPGISKPPEIQGIQILDIPFQDVQSKSLQRVNGSRKIRTSEPMSPSTIDP